VNDEAAFTAAILAEPDEDTPRLVYADWLQEHGREERAEFIRAQVLLAKLEAGEPPECAEPMYRAGFRSAIHHERKVMAAFLDKSETCDCAMCLGRRVSDLFAANVASVRLDESWYPDHPVWLQLPLTNWSRGFVESLQVTAEQWVEHAPRILAAHPIRFVRLTTWPRTVDRDGDTQLDGDPDSVWLDREAAEKSSSDGERFPPALGIGGVLRCRYGRGITFEISAFPPTPFAFTFTRDLPSQAPEMFMRLRQAVACLNASPVCGFGRGRVLFVGADWTRCLDRWRLTLSFETVSPLAGPYHSFEFHDLFQGL